MAVYRVCHPPKIALNCGKTRELTTIFFDLSALVGQFISAKRDLGSRCPNAETRRTVVVEHNVKLRSGLPSLGDVRLRVGHWPDGGSSAIEAKNTVRS
jgi:hypothetical protein